MQVPCFRLRPPMGHYACPHGGRMPLHEKFPQTFQKGKKPVDRRNGMVYNIGDVCVRSFPSASAEENKTHEKRTGFFASDGPYQIRCRRSGVSTPPRAPFVGYAPLGGSIPDPHQPLRFCRGGFFGGHRRHESIVRHIFLREASQYITPCSPLQKTVDSLCRAAPVPLRRPCAPMAARSFPAPVRSPRGRRHILRETGKESALQYQ